MTKTKVQDFKLKTDINLNKIHLKKRRTEERLTREKDKTTFHWRGKERKGMTSDLKKKVTRIGSTSRLLSIRQKRKTTEKTGTPKWAITKRKEWIETKNQSNRLIWSKKWIKFKNTEIYKKRSSWGLKASERLTEKWICTRTDRMKDKNRQEKKRRRQTYRDILSQRRWHHRRNERLTCPQKIDCQHQRSSCVQLKKKKEK